MKAPKTWKTTLAAVALTAALFSLSSCDDADCAGKECSSSTTWCCGGNVMRCGSDGLSATSQTCSGSCSSHSDRHGSAAQCVDDHYPDYDRW